MLQCNKYLVSAAWQAVPFHPLLNFSCQGRIAQPLGSLRAPLGQRAWSCRAVPEVDLNAP
jgi:hypothetical protein